MEDAVVGRSAVQFRACQNCTKAKSRCVPQSANRDGPCTRCHRLKKSCVAKPVAPRKKRVPRTTSRTARLEERLENIVSLLSANKHGQQSLPGRSRSLSSSMSETSSTSPRSSSNRAASTVPTTITSYDQVEPPTRQPTPSQPANLEKLFLGPYARVQPEDLFHRRYAVPTVPPLHPAGTPKWPGWIHELRTPVMSVTGLSPEMQPSDTEANMLLDRYRDYYVRQFPFVIIDKTVTAEQLRTTRPHVYRSVVCVAAFDNPRKHLTRAKELLSVFTCSVMFGAERNLDLLEGMLIIAAWHYYQVGIQTGLSPLMHLIMSVVCDLGIDRPKLNDTEELLENSRNTSSLRAVAAAKKAAAELVEQRVYLGCFTLSSIVSMSFRRIDGLRYGPYVDTCCAALLTSKRQATYDALAVTIARLQAVVEKFEDENNKMRQKESVSQHEIASVLGLQVGHHAAELQRIRDAAPVSLKDDPFFLLQFRSVQIHLHSNALSLPKNSHSGVNDTSPSQPAPLGPSRLSQLYTLLTASYEILQFLTTILSSPVPLVPSFSVLPTSHLVRGMVTQMRLHFLSAADTPAGWDSAEIREKYPLVPTVEKAIELYSKVSELVDPGQHNANGCDVWTLTKRKCEIIKAYYDAKVKGIAGPFPGACDANDTVGAMMTTDSDTDATEGIDQQQQQHQQQQQQYQLQLQQHQVQQADGSSQLNNPHQTPYIQMLQQQQQQLYYPQQLNPVPSQSQLPMPSSMSSFDQAMPLDMQNLDLYTVPPDFWNDDSWRDFMTGWNGVLM